MIARTNGLERVSRSGSGMLCGGLWGHSYMKSRSRGKHGTIRQRYAAAGRTTLVEPDFVPEDAESKVPLRVEPLELLGLFLQHAVHGGRFRCPQDATKPIVRAPLLAPHVGSARVLDVLHFPFFHRWDLFRHASPNVARRR